MSKTKEEFINKWKSWWMLHKNSEELTHAFERELNSVIDHEIKDLISQEQHKLNIIKENDKN